MNLKQIFEFIDNKLNTKKDMLGQLNNKPADEAVSNTMHVWLEPAIDSLTLIKLELEAGTQMGIANAMVQADLFIANRNYIIDKIKEIAKDNPDQFSLILDWFEEDINEFKLLMSMIKS